MSTIVIDIIEVEDDLGNSNDITKNNKSISITETSKNDKHPAILFPLSEI